MMEFTEYNKLNFHAPRGNGLIFGGVEWEPETMEEYLEKFQDDIIGADESSDESSDSEKSSDSEGAIDFIVDDDESSNGIVYDGGDEDDFTRINELLK